MLPNGPRRFRHPAPTAECGEAERGAARSRGCCRQARHPVMSGRQFGCASKFRVGSSWARLGLSEGRGRGQRRHARPPPGPSFARRGARRRPEITRPQAKPGKVTHTLSAGPFHHPGLSRFRDRHGPLADWETDASVDPGGVELGRQGRFAQALRPHQRSGDRAPAPPRCSRRSDEMALPCQFAAVDSRSPPCYTPPGMRSGMP
jgi:hypothetical protein